MAFEMLAIIGAFTALGYFIDKKLNWKFPLATIVLAMLGLGAAFYRILKRP